MKQYNFATLIAFCNRADTRDKIRKAQSILRKQLKLELWELDALFDELKDREHMIEKEERG